MSDRYLMDGQWISAPAARRRLQRAAADLEQSRIFDDLQAAVLIRRNWRMIAARPEIAADVIARAAEVQRALGELSRPEVN